jgi:hypothetical protein
MGQVSNRPTMPPSVEARFAHDSEKAMSATMRPIRLARPSPMPDSPSSEVRLAARTSRLPPMPSGPPPAMSDELWACTMVGTLRVTIGHDELKTLHLNHRAGFLLSLMDASLDLETLVDLSGMPRGEVLEIVRGFYESGVVEFR